MCYIFLRIYFTHLTAGYTNANYVIMKHTVTVTIAVINSGDNAVAFYSVIIVE